MLNIIIVEDNVSLRHELVEFLSRPEWSIRGVECGLEMDIELRKKSTDILILDLNLPNEDGISIAKRVRSAFPSIHIVMLTARSASSDRALGYGVGADVFLTKPANIGEIESVINNIEIRLGKGKKCTTLHLNTINMILEKDTYLPISLTQAEVDFIYQIATANELCIPINYFNQGKKNISVIVSRLRQKFKSIDEENLICTIYGFGYKLSKSISIN